MKNSKLIFIIIKKNNNYGTKACQEDWRSTWHCRYSSYIESPDGHNSWYSVTATVISLAQAITVKYSRRKLHSNTSPEQ
jgi:hypothetical protein